MVIYSASNAFEVVFQYMYHITQLFQIVFSILKLTVKHFSTTAVS